MIENRIFQLDNQNKNIYIEITCKFLKEIQV